MVVPRLARPGVHHRETGRKESVAGATVCNGRIRSWPGAWRARTRP